ncbi:MAG: ARMT1-like domain-containing protein [Candidatus Ozemobacteraceae bacterium]
MKIGPDCLVCLVRQAVEAGRFLGLSDDVQQVLVRSTLAHLAIRTWDVTAPEIAAETQEYLRNLSKNDDPYRSLKDSSTMIALTLLPQWQQQASMELDKLAWVLRLSAAGNLIDCGPTGSFQVEEITQRLHFALHQPFAHNDHEVFRQRLNHARSLLLTADNAGELVTDRLMLEVIECMHPELVITIMVRGGPVLNDVTREEIALSGIPEHWHIIDTHTRFPGLPLHRCPISVQEAFHQSDIVISKGQGNWETLNETAHRGLFFLLTCKCPAVADALGVQAGSGVFVQAANQPHSEAFPASECDSVGIQPRQDQ